MDDYTKVSDKLVAKYGIKVAFVYAKLCYRMKLSHQSKHYFDNGYFIIYKIKDLMHDCHLGKNSVINVLKKLESLHLVHKTPTMFANKLYLPKFDKSNVASSKQTKESFKSKPSKEQRFNNKNYNNYVSSSNRYSVKKAKFQKKNYPKFSEMQKRFGKDLVNYAITVFKRTKEWGHKINSPLHFIYGVLRRWQRKGIKTVNNAMKSEHDSHYVDPKAFDGPDIPLIPLSRI